MAFNNGSFSNCSYDTILDFSDAVVAKKNMYSSTEHFFIVLVLPIIFVVGVLGNMAFIFTVIRVRKMKTVTNTYLVQVSIADFLLVTYTCISYVHSYLLTPVRFDVTYDSFIGCMMTFYFVLTTYFASLILITFVTIERYYAICKPLQHRLVSGKSRTVKIIVASWLLGVVFGGCVVPRYAGFVRYCVKWPEDEMFRAFPSIIELCVPAHPDIYLFSEIFQTAPYFLAMFANIYMYSHIIFALSSRPSTVESDDASNLHTLRVRNQVARLLIINGILFFICQTPYRFASIHNMMVHQSGTGLFNSTQYGSILVISRCFLLANACVNPFVYVTTSSIYRRAFIEALSCTKSSRATSLADNTQSMYIVKQ